MHIHTSELAAAERRCMEALEKFRRPQPGISEGALALRKALLASEGAAALMASATSQPSWARGKAAQVLMSDIARQCHFCGRKDNLVHPLPDQQ